MQEYYNSKIIFFIEMSFYFSIDTFIASFDAKEILNKRHKNYFRILKNYFRIISKKCKKCKNAKNNS